MRDRRSSGWEQQFLGADMSKPEEMALTTNEPRPRITSPERNITITPLDMRQARFTTAIRGFDKADVNTFLQEAAEGFDHAVRENERLRMEIVRLEASLNQFRDLEGSLKTTLMSVQKAQSKTEDIEREIDGLRIKRREAETNLEGTIAALHNTLDFIREQDRREREDRVVQHWPKIAQVASNATRVG